MQNKEKIYTALCLLFSIIIIIGNLTYQKFVSLPIPFYVFEISVGAILYPVTFLITDLISEFYGKERSIYCIRLTIFTNILVVLIIKGMIYLKATPWSKINDITFEQIFGTYSIAFITSIIACYTSQLIDVILYLLIKKLTKNKFLWLRSFLSTSISLFFDTSIVILLLSLFNIIPKDKIWYLIINSYSFKVCFTIVFIPIFYLAVFLMKFLLKEKKL